MANISSYNQLSNWNEDDDLLFVQQPDAPKKAHPSQMKEYVEAGDFEATGDVKDGHGNILKDMAKSAIIGDLSQTGLTGDSVAAQLETAGEQIADLNTHKQDNLKIVSGKLASTAGTITIHYPTGVNKNDYYIVGWNILLNDSKYSGYNMGHSGTMLSMALNDSNISVYNNDASFYGSWIYIILAKI